MGHVFHIKVRSEITYFSLTSLLCLDALLPNGHLSPTLSCKEDK